MRAKPPEGPVTAEWLESIGYRVPMQIGGRWTAICPLIFEWRVVTDLDHAGWSEAWDFKTATEAQQAMLAWDGVGDLPGPWLKHRPSERRGPGVEL